MDIIQRTFYLIDGKRDEFLHCMEDYYSAIEHDETVSTFAVLIPEDTESVVVVRFVLNEGATWEQRMQLDYVQEFLGRVHSLIERVETSNDKVLRFYSH